jgi:photosystem II protein
LVVQVAEVKPKAKAKKPRTEDGIFGTSGGIGFTKQNELFVGRVAMIGFAVSLGHEAFHGRQRSRSVSVSVSGLGFLVVFFVFFFFVVFVFFVFVFFVFFFL